MNKKLIFILGAPRSGTTLLLSFLCGIPNTKILYETRKLITERSEHLIPREERNLVSIANYFDSFEEEIVIEKTPEHALCLEDIDKLRGICKRDIHVVYILRPPVPTILSLIKASKIWRQEEGQPPYVGILGFCEKYEESLVSIYNNLILKSNEPSIPIVDKPVYSTDVLDSIVEVDSYQDTTNIPYSFSIKYRELVDNTYDTIKNLLENLYIKADIQSLIDNRIPNIAKVVPQITNKKCHTNVLRGVDEVEIERRAKISRQVIEGFTDEYKEKVRNIRNYFEHPISKETIYDVVVNKKVLPTLYNPLVTVVVPLYNKEKYIVETLESIFSQTYQNIRVIVIDDCSTDKSLEIARKYIASLNSELQNKYSDYLLEKNCGVAYTRNTGLSNIKAQLTDIVTFCDADDIWDSTLVEKSINTFVKYPYTDCVYSRVLNKKEEIIEKNHSKICNGNVYSDALEYQFLNCGSNLFVKASVIRNSDIKFNEGFSGCEDWDFLIQLSKISVFKCTKEYLVTYRQDVPNSMSSDKAYQFEGCKKVIYKYLTGDSRFKRIFTRHYLYYFSTKLLKWENIKNLDFSYILRIIVSKLKSFVKLYLL